MPVLCRPAHEVAGLVAVADRGIGHPTFQVRLGARPQRESFVVKPGQEAVGCGDVAANVHVLEPGGVVVAEAASEPAHVVPDRVAVQDPTLGEIRAGLDRLSDPFLQGDEPFVAGQGAGRDQDTAQVGQRLARGSPSRTSRVTGRSSRPVRSRRSRALEGEGWLVARDMSKSAVRPQLPHSAVILGR
ncbi:hypothetical protein [Streptomyces sp. CC210A]|uniref:hypothetical protein n=1 Tax=Streptomyces sp. CC210A TaxID=2898184 RepID=UPI001F46B574|nr:hypothetical protein [Streptomyces sp. CC210A]